MMTANELRQKYVDFFKTKGHAEIPSASVVPENDPTVLFTTAQFQLQQLMASAHNQAVGKIHISATSQ